MGDSELVSKPTVTYQASGESKTYTISDMARKTVTLAQDGLEAALTTDAGDNVYPGEKIHLKLSIKNTGNNGYTGLTATLSDGTVMASDISLAAGANFEQTIEWAPAQSGAVTVQVDGMSDNGEAASVASEELTITTPVGCDGTSHVTERPRSQARNAARARMPHGQEAPPASDGFSTAMQPVTWKNGIEISDERCGALGSGSGGFSPRRRKARAPATAPAMMLELTARWVASAPFGLPVVPEV